ncbi:MAG: methyltransferase domain-containing protein [Nitrospinae bacterium]|nr:methyltransferase domain-containing protein [Nitrospinota bacterium]
MDIFDGIAEQYDAWYGTPRGKAVFAAELAALQRVGAAGDGWAELGVGTGRFAAGLGIRYGFDTARNMLLSARARKVAVCAADAAALPVKGGALEGCLIMMTLCFLKNPSAALRETARALKPEGALVIGFVPREGAWGTAYALMAEEGHPVYSRGRYYTSAAVRAMAEAAGFVFVRAASALFFGPGEEPPKTVCAEDGLSPAAGFAAMRFAKRR